MFGRVYISCTASLGQGGLGYHMQFIAKSAYMNSGEQPYVYCVDGIGDGHIRPIKSEPNWMFLCNYTPARWLPSVQNFIRQRHFDQMVARVIPHRAVTLHSFPGIAESSFRAVLRNGGTTVLEAATIHVKDLFRRVSQEHDAHGLGGSPFSHKWVNKALREYELTDFITVSSELQRASFIENGIPASKLLYAPLGVDSNKFFPYESQFSQRPRRDGEKFRIIQVGQVSLLKGFQYTLKALELLNDPEIELVLFGGIGWRSIRSVIDSYRNKGIRVENVSGDPLPWLRSSHICIHPSLSDGFGLAPLEAMSTGIPTIVTRETGMKDIITDGISGYIIAPKSAEELAERIYQLKANDSLRMKMGRAARIAALPYDADLCERKYSEIMNPVWNAVNRCWGENGVQSSHCHA